MRRFWLAVGTLFERELVRFWREKTRVVGFVGSPLIFWLVIGSGFGDLGFFFPGALTLTVMFSAIFSTMSIIEDRREGFLLSMLVSPAPRSSMVLGKILGSSTLAWIQALMLLVFVPLAGLEVTPLSLLALAGVLFLIAFAFTGLGFLVAWKMNSAQAFHGIINLLLMPLWMVSGALFGLGSAHGWMRWLMRANPLTYPTMALKRLLSSEVEAGTPSMGVCLAVTVAWAVAWWIASTLVARRKASGSAA